MTHATGALRVRVPCSTSNLGAGFDTVGLALDRYLEIAYSPGDEPLRVERNGTLAALDVDDDSDVVVRVLRAQLPACGGVLRASSNIPVGRGLGSSAAAAVAACVLARAVSGAEPDADTVFRAAEAIDGHPDNAAPATYGGLVAVARDDTAAARVLRLPVSDDIGWAYAAPGAPLSTAQARAALPAHVAHDAAARGLGRAAALLAGLANADPELLRIGFTDELHVPYRLRLIPGAERVREAALDAGAWAVTISGAGSGMIATCATDDADEVADAMAAAFRDAGGAGALGFAARVERTGARVLRGDE